MNENMAMNTQNHNDMISMAYDRYLRRGMTSSALMRDANPIAGFLLPEEFEAKLINAMNHFGVIRGLCTNVKTVRDRIIPMVTGHGQPAWIPEGGSIPLVKDTFDRVVLGSHVLAATVRVSSELLKESGIDIEKYLADTLAERMTLAEEEAFIAGDGGVMPRGLVHQAKVGRETQAAGTVTVEDVLNLIFSVPEKHRKNGVLLMNENTLLGLYKQCIVSGANLWLGKTNDGKADTLFGYPIVRCGAMPGAETGNIPILFGDFKQVYINDCSNRGLRRIDELYAENDQVGFMLGERVGIQLVVPDAIKGLKAA